MNTKYNELKEYIKKLNSVAVAYSGGVDSTLLLYAAKEVLGDNVIAITAKSYLFPDKETEETVVFCRNNGIKQIIIEHKALELDGFAENPRNKCYICKKAMFSKMLDVAKRENMKYILEGSNLDDMGDFRPGMLAVSELGIKSALRQVGMTKAEIRSISKELGLPTFDKPSYACLASRFVYGEEINEKKLEKVEKAEKLLTESGFSQVRVRVHNMSARIEIMPYEFEKIIEDNMRVYIYNELKKIGFHYISLDLKGYRTGSMNEMNNI